MSLFRAALPLLSLLALGACREATEIVVVTASDLTVPGELDGVHLEVVGHEKHDWSLVTSNPDPARRQIVLPVIWAIYAGRFPDESIEIIARGSVGTGTLAERSIVTHRARVKFVRGRIKLLRLDLTRACRGRVCEKDNRDLLDYSDAEAHRSLSTTGGDGGPDLPPADARADGPRTDGPRRDGPRGDVRPGEKVIKLDQKPWPDTRAADRPRQPDQLKPDQAWLCNQKPTAAQKVCTLNATNNITFCRIDAGCFDMGSELTENCRQPAGFEPEPRHRVTLRRSFLISQTEITIAQYKAVMNKLPAALSDPALRCKSPANDCPVTSVSWPEAAQFCNALSNKEKSQLCFDPNTSAPISGYYNCAGYRLPTEAEWEHAARAGWTEATYNGNLSSACYNEPVLVSIAWYSDHRNGQWLEPVKQLSPNGWGLNDMLGNAWEWTVDEVHNNPSNLNPVDPVFLSTPTAGKEYVIRGGSVLDGAAVIRAATRTSWELPASTPPTPGAQWVIGFRCVRSLTFIP